MTDRDRQADWQTARIVAMIAATNSKRERYEPVKWMQGGKELLRQARERRARREPMTGDEIMARIRALRIPVIDVRANKQEQT